MLFGVPGIVNAECSAVDQACLASPFCAQKTSWEKWQKGYNSFGGGVLSSRRNIDRTHLNHFLYKTHARPTEEERLLRPHSSDEELLVVDEGGRVIFFVVGGRC